VVTDLKMPRVDGLDLLKAVRDIQPIGRFSPSLRDMERGICGQAMKMGADITSLSLLICLNSEFVSTSIWKSIDLKRTSGSRRHLDKRYGMEKTLSENRS